MIPLKSSKLPRLMFTLTLAASLCLTAASPALAAPGSVSPSLSVTGPIPCDGSTTVTLTVDGVSPPPSQVPVDVMLVLDRSGSMAGTPLSNLRIAANSFVDDMDGADGSLDGAITASRVGQVSFSDSPTLDIVLTQNAAAVHAKINALTFYNLTNIGDAVTMAATQLSGGSAKDVMVLMTDGQSNVGSSPLAAAANAKAAGIEIFTIGLGVGVNTAQLTAMASDASHYYAAPSSDQLEAIFHAIATGVAGPAGTDLAYNVQPAQGFELTAGSASVGGISTSPSSLTWTLNELRSETAQITYTLKHTGASGGTLPIHAVARLTYRDADDAMQAVDYSAASVEVQGCNQPPVANAGPDQTLPQGADGLALVTLDGSGSTDDGQLQPLDFVWSEGAVPLGTEAAFPHAFALGAHVVTLTVSDGEYSDSSDVIITVTDPFPPATTATVDGTAGNNGWYMSPVTVTLTAADNTGGSGVAGTFYSVDGDPFAAYGGPLLLAADGAHSLRFYSTDGAGNDEPIQEIGPMIDTAAPVISIGSPLGEAYPDDTMLTIDWTATDGASGVAASSALLDGAPVADGAVVDLATLPLGVHSVAVTATDDAGNAATQELQFQTVVTYDSLTGLKHRFFEQGLIKNQGIVMSLDQKLRAAQRANEREQYTTEDNILWAFVAEVKAQTGKWILEPAATILIRDAEWLMSQN